jgi:hypothetical protein
VRGAGRISDGEMRREYRKEKRYETPQFFIYQLTHKRVALKILKFTLKQLRHVSV